MLRAATFWEATGFLDKVGNYIIGMKFEKKSDRAFIFSTNSIKCLNFVRYKRILHVYINLSYLFINLFVYLSIFLFTCLFTCYYLCLHVGLTDCLLDYKKRMNCLSHMDWQYSNPVINSIIPAGKLRQAEGN